MATVITNSYCNRSTTSLFFPPWQNPTPSTTGGVAAEVMWMPPFGANTTIVRLQLFLQSSAGNTTITIRNINEDILATADVVNISDPTLVYEIDFNYVLGSASPIIIGIDPTTTPNGVRVQLISEETIPA